jgi:hypothetical protein
VRCVCCAVSVPQSFSFQGTHGPIASTSSGKCLEGACTSSGCELLPFVSCTGSSSQTWTLNADHTITNGGQGGARARVVWLRERRGLAWQVLVWL